MLQSDEIILKILLKAKNEGNQLLEHFKIGYPSKQVVQESNNIFVGAVDSESNLDGFEFSSFTDLVEVLIVTKNRNYVESVKIIKIVAKEITRLIYENVDLFDEKPVIRCSSRAGRTVPGQDFLKVESRIGKACPCKGGKYSKGRKDQYGL